MASSCEHGNETLSSIKGIEFVQQLPHCQLHTVSPQPVTLVHHWYRTQMICVVNAQLYLTKQIKFQLYDSR